MQVNTNSSSNPVPDTLAQTTNPEASEAPAKCDSLKLLRNGDSEGGENEKI